VRKHILRMAPKSARVKDRKTFRRGRGVLSQSFREFFLVFDFGATSGKNQD
jgi:hypothetical protein